MLIRSIVQCLLVCLLWMKSAPLYAAAINGDITAGVLTLDGDIDANQLTISYALGPERYLLASPMGDTITVTDNDPNATVMGSGTNSVAVIIADANMTSLDVSGNEGDDMFVLMTLNDPITLRGNQNNDTFQVMENVTADILGGQDNDNTQLASGVVVMGVVNGQAGFDSIVRTGDGCDVVLQSSNSNGFSGTMTNISGGFQDIKVVIVNGTGCNFTGRDVASTWTIDALPGYADGTNTIDFNGFETIHGGSAENEFQVIQAAPENIVGGNMDDILTLSDGVVLGGSFSGGFGSDEIEFQANNTTVTLTASMAQGFTGTAAPIAGGFDGVDEIIASGSNATLMGMPSTTLDPAIWNLNNFPLFNNNTHGMLFSGFATLEGASGGNNFNVSVNSTANIVGGANDDHLNLTNSSVLTGSFDGVSGDDKISSDGADFDVVLTSSSSGGFGGTVAAITGGFALVDELVATGAGSSLTGRDGPGEWVMDGVNQYVVPDNPSQDGVSNILDFSGFEDLIGQGGIDEFLVLQDRTLNMSGGGGQDLFTVSFNDTVTGSIDGGADSDTLILSGSNLTVTLTDSTTEGFSGDVAVVTGGFQGIDTLETTGSSNVLAGTPSGNANPVVWELDGTPTFFNNTHTLGFSGFETLNGPADGNIFNVTANSSFDLNGASGVDTLNLINDAGLTGSFDAKGGSQDKVFSNTPIFFNVIVLDQTGDGYRLQHSGALPSSGINIIEGPGSNAQLSGRDVTAEWTLGSTNIYRDDLVVGAEGTGSDLVFSGIEGINGGDGADTFTVAQSTSLDIAGGAGVDHLIIAASQTLTGSFDGETGNDELTLNTDGSAVVLTDSVGAGFEGTATGITSLFSGIDLIRSNGDVSSITGFTPNALCDWTIASNPLLNNGSHSLDFRGFGIVNGCNAENDVIISDSIGANVGQSLEFNGAAFDDQMLINLDGGLGLSIPVTFNGSDEETVAGDILNIVFVNPGVGEYTFGTAGGPAIDGTLSLPGSSLITFTGLESPLAPPGGLTSVVADFEAIVDTHVLQSVGGGQWAIDSGSVRYLESSWAGNLLTIRPPSGGSLNPLQIGPLDSSFDAGLSVEQPPGSGNHVDVIAPLTPAANNSIEIRAEEIDVRDQVALTGAGFITLESNIGVLLSTGSATLETANQTIDIDADAVQASGAFISVPGSLIDSGTGDINLNAHSMEIGGPISGGQVTLTGSLPDSSFFLGELDRGPDVNTLAGGPSSIELTTSEINQISASNQLTLGNAQHAGITIQSALDFTGRVETLSLVTRNNGLISDLANSAADLTVTTFNPSGTLNPRGVARSIFELEGTFAPLGVSTVKVEIGGLNPGPAPDDHDQVNVIGAVSLDAQPALEINLVNGFTPTENDQFVMVNNDGGDAITGIFAGLPESSTISLGPFGFEISYLGTDGTTGNDVVLTALPPDPNFILSNGFEN